MYLKQNNAGFQRPVKILAVTKKNGQRYVITDPVDAVVYDAQGFGFRTQSKAEAFADAQGWMVINRDAVESNSLI